MIKTKNIVAALGVLAGTGVLAMPLDGHAASNTATADISVNVGSFIELSIEGSSTVSVTMNANEDRADAGDKTVLKVNTNNGGGYRITAEDNVAANAGKLKNGTATIDPMVDGDSAPTGSIGKWGLNVGTKWYGINGTAKDIANYSNLTTYSTDVLYGFSTKEDQAAGTYTGTVKFTAIVNGASS